MQLWYVLTFLSYRADKGRRIGRIGGFGGGGPSPPPMGGGG